MQQYPGQGAKSQTTLSVLRSRGAKLVPIARDKPAYASAATALSHRVPNGYCCGFAKCMPCWRPGCYSGLCRKWVFSECNSLFNVRPCPDITTTVRLRVLALQLPEQLFMTCAYTLPGITHCGMMMCRMISNCQAATRCRSNKHQQQPYVELQTRKLRQAGCSASTVCQSCRMSDLVCCYRQQH
jgi:hypothetical protein